MNTNHPVVHFEMPYEDLQRVTEFYSKAFGWGMGDAGEEMGHYVVATTTETGEDSRPTKPGTINGGFYPKTPEGAQHPSVVIYVEDIEVGVKNISEAGGKVLGEPLN